MKWTNSLKIQINKIDTTLNRKSEESYYLLIIEIPCTKKKNEVMSLKDEKLYKWELRNHSINVVPSNHTSEWKHRGHIKPFYDCFHMSTPSETLHKTPHLNPAQVSDPPYPEQLNSVIWSQYILGMWFVKVCTHYMLNLYFTDKINCNMQHFTHVKIIFCTTYYIVIKPSWAYEK